MHGIRRDDEETVWEYEHEALILSKISLERKIQISYEA